MWKTFKIFIENNITRFKYFSTFYLTTFETLSFFRLQLKVLFLKDLFLSDLHPRLFAANS